MAAIRTIEAEEDGAQRSHASQPSGPALLSVRDGAGAPGGPNVSQGRARRRERRTRRRRRRLDQWIEAHPVEVKPKTLQDYPHLIDRHVKPYIGALRLQAVHLSDQSFYRHLVTAGAAAAQACHQGPWSMCTPC